MAATKFQSNIEELKSYVDHMQKLLAQPEPGLVTWHAAYQAAAKKLLDFFHDEPLAKGKSKPDLIGKDVPLPGNPKEIPVPTCPRCGEEVPYFYNYIYRLAASEGTMIFQSQCCPHWNCRAILIVLPIGLEAGSVAVPGKPGWPGMPS